MAFELKKGEKYIFATDLDGTLLTHFVSSIHIDTYEAVKMIKERGDHFVIATGRSWWWAKTIYEQLGLVDASIHFSGAIVQHPTDKNFKEFRSSIPKEVIFKLIDDIDLWSFAKTISAVGRKYHATWGKDDDLKKLFFNCYEYIINYPKADVDTDKLLLKIKASIGEHYELRVWSLFGDEQNNTIIISPEGTNKAVGLKKIAKYYEIPQENVIYFGDNINDIEALKWAGHSYVPNDATDGAKEVADEILDGTCTTGVVPKKIIQLLKKQDEIN